MPLDLAPGLIDIHCHLLYGLDDGSPTLDASSHMCALAQAAGTAAMVATPHANHRFTFDPQEARARCACLQELAPPPLRLFTGCELEMSLETLPKAFGNGGNDGSHTLNGSRYLLLELMPAGLPANVEGVLARMLDRGVTPVVAHPERNAYLQRHPERLATWVERGCLAQLTAGSLTGKLGRLVQANAAELLRRRLAHFVASDAHDPIRRPPILLDAYRLVGRELSPELAELLFVWNPRAVLEDREIRAWPAF
jgi:protein-tyrosine phosphatase